MPTTKTRTNGAHTNGTGRKRRLPPVEIGSYLISETFTTITPSAGIQNPRGAHG